ncbi:MAG: hypothetical protein NC206_04025 [Bacteroides sp.]|nr:hypothetical protein [Roseburia sp.]MCM1346235.1 hypothetical protein [Bacteroides sp.]MCM1421111.1 hypothetical protein [Bacteroides sp.]
MKKIFSLMTTSLFAVNITAAEWSIPVPEQMASQVSVLQENQTDTVFYYLYLKDAGLYYCAGNAYGTQASIGASGLKVFFKACAPDGGVWDGNTVTVENYFNGAWKELFNDDGMLGYVDRRAQPNYMWEIESEGKSFHIYNAALNPSYNTKEGKLYLGLDLSNGETTALSTCVQPEIGVSGDCNYDWLLVPSNYYEAELLPKILCYQTAQELAGLINETKENYPEIDLSAYEAVYNNTSSTVDELKAAITGVKSSMILSIAGEASIDNPVNLSERAFAQLGIAYNFDDKSIIGWSSTTGSKSNAANNGNAAADVAVTGNHFENWSPDVMLTGTISATAKNLPVGLYKVEALAFCNTSFNQSGEGVYFFANDKNVRVTTEKIEVGKELSISVVLNEPGDIVFGLDMPTATDNWVGLDNVYIYYYGPVADDPNKILLDEAIRNAEAVYSDISEVYANQDVINAYENALEQAKSATDYSAALEIFTASVNNLNTSVVSYAVLKTLIEKVERLSVEYDASYPELGAMLGDFGMEWNDQYYTTREYTDEIIAGLEAKLNSTIVDYISSNAKPGDDITVLIQNPTYDTDVTGWENAGAVPAFGGMDAITGGAMADIKLTSGCAEVWHKAFNTYQTIAALPAGVYRLSVQGFESDEGQDVPVATYLYAKTTGSDAIQKQALNDIHDFATAEQLFVGKSWTDVEVNGLWEPSGMPSANYHFNHDEDGDGVNDYTLSMNVVLSNPGDLTFGIMTDKVDRWVIWDNFTLTYLGEDLTAYEEIVVTLKKQADVVRNTANSNSGIGTDALQRLDAAIEGTNSCHTSEEYDKAISELRAAIDYAEKSIELYNQLNELLDLLIEAMDMGDNVKVQAEAGELVNELAEVVSDYNYTNAQMEEAIEKGNSILVRINIPADAENASKDHPVDLTMMIKNADIEQGAGVAWTINKPKGGNGPVLASGINGQSMEYWCGSAASGAFDYNQSLGKDLPVGEYELKASVANSYSDLLEMNPDHETTDGEIGLYAVVGGDTVYTLVPTQTELCTKAWQEPVLKFSVKEQGAMVVIGVKNFDTMTARWTVMDDFKLTYFGVDPTSIMDVATPENAVPQAIYDVSGRAVKNLVKGINIVRMSDGSVRKIMVK